MAQEEKNVEHSLEERRTDEHVKYLKKHICDKDSGKPFVFISYRSDDWYKVLHDIVYRLVKDYGLNVYFDGSFDDHNSLWIKQFTKNMEHTNCKGVLAFFNDNYATSYATLLELMYSQTVSAGEGGRKEEYDEGLPVVPINLGDFTRIESQEDTYLGKKYYKRKDGTLKENINRKSEVKTFNDTFDELVEREILITSKYLYKGKNLSKKICSKMVKELSGYIGVNDNYYITGQSLDAIVNSIKDEEEGIGTNVFSAPYGPDTDGPDTDEPDTDGPDTDEPDTDGPDTDGPDTDGPDTDGPDTDGPDTDETDGPPTPTITLLNFLKKYNISNFKKDTFSKIRLVGKGQYAKYSTDYFDSTYELTWYFIMRILEEKKESYIHFVNEKNAGTKNPPFITAEVHQKRKEEKSSVKYHEVTVEGLKHYSMCRHFGQYDWIKSVLKRRMEELELPLEEFFFEYEVSDGTEGTGNKQLDKKEKKQGNIGKRGDKKPKNKEDDEDVKPIGLGGNKGTTQQTSSKNFAGDKINLSVYGIRYEGKTQTEMQCIIFEEVMKRHTDKIDTLIESIPCIAENQKISKELKNSFRTGEIKEIAGRTIAIGTSLNMQYKKKYIASLMRICEESKDNVVIEDHPY